MQLNSQIDSRYRYFFAGWWILWASIHFYVVHSYGVISRVALVDSLVSNTLLAGVCLLIINNLKYYLPRRERYGYLLALSLVLSLLWIVLTRFCSLAHPPHLRTLQDLSVRQYHPSFCHRLSHDRLYVGHESALVQCQRTKAG